MFALYFPVQEISRGFSSQRETVRVPSLFYTRAWHNLGKALGEGLGLLCALFTSLSLSPLYPSLSLSFSPSLPLSLSLISPSPFLATFFGDSLCLKWPSLICFFQFTKEVCIDFNFIYCYRLSLSLSGVSNGRFRPCFIFFCNKEKEKRCVQIITDQIHLL